MLYADSVGQDQTAQSRSLILALSVRLLNHCAYIHAVTSIECPH